VKQNFSRYGLLDERVRFLHGWFKDTLPTAPINAVSILRLDGDIYESTMDALTALYPKVSPGGFVIVDDYGSVEGCRTAVEDYRKMHNLSEPIQWVEDWQRACVFWRRSR
jgi:O-methyltransferase